jgi:hypothetical protein
MLKVTGINFRQVVIVCGLISAGFSFGSPAIAANECVLLPSNSPTSFCPYNSDQSNCRAPTSGSIGCYTIPPNPTQLFVTSNSSCKDDPRTNATGTNTCKSTQRLDCNTISCVCTFCGDASATFNGTLNSCTSGNISTQGAPCAGSPSLLTVASGRTFNSNCPSGGIYTNTCGGVGCPAGTFLSGGACVPNPVYMQLNAAQSGWFAVTSNNAPGAPVALGSMYFDTAGGANVYKFWNGTAWTNMSGGGGVGTLTGTGAAGQVSFWSGASSLASDAAFAWNNTTKQLTLGTGTAAAPAFSFSGDPDTGIFGGTNQLNFSTGGVSKVQIDSAGKLRVGENAVGSAVAAVTADFADTSHTIVRLWGADNLWQGFRWDRPVPLPSGPTTNEQWFIGMPGNNTNLVFRRTSTVNVMTLDGQGRLTLRGSDIDLPGVLRLMEPSVSGTNFTEFRTSPNQTADVTYMLPPADGSNGQVLSTSGTGVLSWSSSGVAGGGACGGRRFTTFSGFSYDGNLNQTAGSAGSPSPLGYDAADDLCPAGSKVCTVDEMLNSIKCPADATHPALNTLTGRAWVNAGPPGFLANMNDCSGWSTDTFVNGNFNYGRVWLFDTKGGLGTGFACNELARFACCS